VKGKFLFLISYLAPDSYIHSSGIVTLETQVANCDRKISKE